MTQIKLREYSAQLLELNYRKAEVGQIDETVAHIRKALLPWIFAYSVLLVVCITATLWNCLRFIENSLSGDVWGIWTWSFCASALCLAGAIWLGNAAQHGHLAKLIGNIDHIDIPPKIAELFAQLANRKMAATYGIDGPSVPVDIFASAWAFLFLSENKALRKWVRPWWGLGDTREIVITVVSSELVPSVQPITVNLQLHHNTLNAVIDQRQQAIIIQPMTAAAPEKAPTMSGSAQKEQEKPTTQRSEPRKITDDFWMVGLPFNKLGSAIDAWTAKEALATNDAIVFREIYLDAYRRVNGPSRPVTLKLLTGQVYEHIKAQSKSGDLLGKIPAEGTVGIMLSSSTSKSHKYTKFKLFIAAQGVARGALDDKGPELF